MNYKKIVYGIVAYAIISLMLGVLGAGCEDTLHRNVTPYKFIEITITTGFFMSTAIGLMFGSALLLVYCFKKILE